jgi:hypothetical protein
LDAAPEILDGSLVFLIVRDASAEPQTVSVVIDGRRSLPRVARIVADRLAETVSRQLAAVRENGVKDDPLSNKGDLCNIAQ